MNIEELESLLEVLPVTPYRLPDYIPFPYTSMIEIKEDVASAIQEQIDGKVSTKELKIVLESMIIHSMLLRVDFVVLASQREMTIQIEYTDHSREEYYLDLP
jgi:hypothetical protein